MKKLIAKLHLKGFKELASKVEAVSLKEALQDYTTLGGSRIALEKFKNSKEAKNFAVATQTILKKIGYSNSIIGFRGSGDYGFTYAERGGKIPLGSFVSFGENQVPKEFKKAPIQITAKISLDKILAHYKANPDVFTIKSEKELITLSPTILYVTNVYSDTDFDTGEKINIRIHGIVK